MKKKDKKLHDIMKHSNGVTKSIVEKYNLINAKEIAKVNQVTDLLLSLKEKDKRLMDIILEAASNAVNGVEQLEAPVEEITID